MAPARVTGALDILRPEPRDADQRGRLLRDLLLLVAFCAVAFFVLLGHRELSNPDEGRYAEIPREMIASGDWVTPRINGLRFFDKPPLVYWAVAVCIKAFGAAEWSVRLPPALFASLGVFAVYGAGRRLFGRKAGLYSAFVLGGSLLYFAMGRMLLLDMAVAVCISAVLLFFLLGARAPAGRERRLLFYGVYASAALGTLAKGPMAFLLPGVVMFLWLLLGNRWRQLRPFYPITGGLIFLSIALPWHVLVAMRNPDWAHYYFVSEHWLRYTTDMHGREHPLWIYLPIVGVGLFPWTGFLWPALRSAWARRTGDAGDRGTTSFLLIWAAFILVFFSASSSTQVPYIIPVLPPLAILIGRWLAVENTGSRRPNLSGPVLFAGVATVLVAAIAWLTFMPDSSPGGGDLSAMRPVAFALMAVLGAGALLVAAGRGRVRRWTVPVMLATSLATGLLLEVVAPYVTTPGTKPLAAIVREHLEPGDRIYHYGDFFHDFDFYAEMNVVAVGDLGDIRGKPRAEGRANGTVIDASRFRAEMRLPGRTWIVVDKGRAEDLMSDSHLAATHCIESRGHILICNDPPAAVIAMADPEKDYVLGDESENTRQF